MYVDEKRRKLYNKQSNSSLIKDSSFYTLNKPREEKKMIEDTEATMELHGMCVEVGEPLVLDTQRGVEIGHNIDTSDIREILKNKGVEHLFCDICMEGFCLDGVSKEFYKDIIRHLTGTDSVEVVLYGDPEPVFFQGEWRKIAPHLWKYDRLGAFCSYRTEVVQFEKYKRKDVWKFEYEKEIGEYKLLYFEGVMVYPDLQNLGYGHELMREAIKKEKPDFVALRTQNPQMYSAFKKIVKDIYPNTDKKIPDYIETISQRLAKDLGMDSYDKRTMRGLGTYGRCMYGRIPAPTNGTEILFSSINPFKGDCFVCVGEPKKEGE